MRLVRVMGVGMGVNVSGFMFQVSIKYAMVVEFKLAVLPSHATIPIDGTFSDATAYDLPSVARIILVWLAPIDALLEDTDFHSQSILITFAFAKSMHSCGTYAHC